MTLLESALQYARAGFKVLSLHSPIRHDEGVLCSCLEIKCQSIGKHPKGIRRAMINEASRDQVVIKKWWEKWPNANVGICTDGFAVIDIDPVHEGPKNWEVVCLGQKLPNAPKVITGSGGCHLFFRADEAIPNSIDRIARGVDVRGAGGYAVAPPSIHASGASYAWSDLTDDMLLRVGFMPFLPDWLRVKCLTKTTTERGTEYSDAVSEEAV